MTNYHYGPLYSEAIRQLQQSPRAGDVLPYKINNPYQAAMAMLSAPGVSEYLGGGYYQNAPPAPQLAPGNVTYPNPNSSSGGGYVLPGNIPYVVNTGIPFRPGVTDVHQAIATGDILPNYTIGPGSPGPAYYRLPGVPEPSFSDLEDGSYPAYTGPNYGPYGNGEYYPEYGGGRPFSYYGNGDFLPAGGEW